MKFTRANYNPKENKVGDCVVRAIMRAENKTWLEVYDELCAVGRTLCAMPNDQVTYQKYLETLGWQKQKMPRFPNYSRYTVEEFADEFDNNTFIVSIANHLTIIDDGELFDSWNCGYKSVGNIWKR